MDNIYKTIKLLTYHATRRKYLKITLLGLRQILTVHFGMKKVIGFWNGFQTNHIFGAIVRFYEKWKSMILARKTKKLDSKRYS